MQQEFLSQNLVIWKTRSCSICVTRSASHHRTLVPKVSNLTSGSMYISKIHLRIFYARLARHSNHGLLDCHFLHMLCSQGALQHKQHTFNSAHMPAYLSTVSKRRYHNLNLYQHLHLFPSENFICCRCRCGFAVQ